MEGVYLLGAEDWRAAVMIGTLAFLELYVCAQSLSYVCSAGPLFMKLFQARIVEWVAIFYSEGLSNSRIEPASLVPPALAGRFFTTAPPRKPVEAV